MVNCTYYQQSIMLSTSFYIFQQFLFQVRLGIHWLVCGLLVVVLVWYTYEMQQADHKATAVESGIYTGFSRLIWSFIVMMVIHACITGHGGPVNAFLSLPMWRPLSRLTYAIYLIHMPVMMLTTGSLKRPIYFAFRGNVRLQCHFHTQHESKTKFSFFDFSAIQILW